MITLGKISGAFEAENNMQRKSSQVYVEIPQNKLHTVCAATESECKFECQPSSHHQQHFHIHIHKCMNVCVCTRPYLFHFYATLHFVSIFRRFAVRLFLELVWVELESLLLLLLLLLSAFVAVSRASCFLLIGFYFILCYFAA